MSNEKVFQMKLQKVYPLLVAKAEKKGRSRGEVDAAACWLTGYSQEQLAALLDRMIENFIHTGNVGSCTDDCRKILECALQRVI